ncbi:Planctomycete cytochrome C [Anatilimnocola aggregata]|uniref:Planctomycete cytochrome C n=1 Tax=Anatilimnocola aggregata TaxID=2528021 RepID=A0A517YDP9_9BACT|nr:DUF1592 domain-containing protein [Anatilimnocola aggregata]QDU28364.1 Planctomycete cytochrome C [Anatilimnocola aggregata]
MRTFSHISHFILLAMVGVNAAGAQDVPAKPTTFLKEHCLDCHTGKSAEAGLDLTKLGTELGDKKTEHFWVRIFDRVQSGEMPPKDAVRPPVAATKAFLQATGNWIRETQHARDAEIGRVQSRRLTRREIERSLHDLLGIDIPLADQLPEEARSAGFNTVADGQAMSHFQMERQLAVVDLALDEAFHRALAPHEPLQKVFGPKEIVRSDPKRRTREPEMLDGRAVTWSSGLIFYGRLPVTTAKESGWYRFKVRVAGLKAPATGGVWTTVRTGLCVSSAPLLNWVTSFEAEEAAKEIEFEAWLPARHMLEIRPGDITLKKGRFNGGQVGAGEGGPQNVPGIAIEQITMERIHHGATHEGIRQLLFGSLKVVRDKKGGTYHVETNAPKKDAAQLLKAFARRVFRRPASDEQLQRYVEIVHAAIDDGVEFSSALRIGYRAMLCSPRFLYLTEEPGQLDEHAIAARLSYFLTGSTPDAELSSLADAGQLHKSPVLRGQVERLLAGQRGRQFVVDFAAQWLDLELIDFTEPDSKLFPDYDSIVQHSMLDETHTYLTTMLQKNQSVTRLVKSDYTYLNSRLARFYDLSGVTGDNLQQITLAPESHRGGVLTQGAILKVTANGSNTSPVVRGVWVSERLMGVPIPPPPDNVPAIEPDIRGATSVREQLAKHRSQDTCASCHVKIDPPGFALENFDPAGRWREKYVLLASGKRTQGPKIDASYEMPDGRKFENVDDFRALIANQPRQLAANLAEKLLTYGTGGPVSFADREEVERIVDATAKDSFGFRTIVKEVAASNVFLTK